MRCIKAFPGALRVLIKVLQAAKWKGLFECCDVFMTRVGQKDTSNGSSEGCPHTKTHPRTLVTNPSACSRSSVQWRCTPAYYSLGFGQNTSALTSCWVTLMSLIVLHSGCVNLSWADSLMCLYGKSLLSKCPSEQLTFMDRMANSAAHLLLGSRSHNHHHNKSPSSVVLM